jgi:hypothetical protein
MEAKSQAVPNTLTEHDFKDAFKNGRSAGNCTFARKGVTSKLIVAIRSKIMDGSLYFVVVVVVVVVQQLLLLPRR